MLAQFRGHAVASFQRYPVSTRLANAVLVYAKYVEKAFLPTGLIVYYPHRGDTWTAASVVIAAAILLAVSLIAIAALRRFPFLAVGWAWYLGTLIPMIGLVQIGGQQMADRYTYFPLIGVFVAVVWLLAAIWPQHALGRRILSVVAVGCYLALGYLSLIQIAYWHDGVRLFEHALACGPDNAFSRNQLGCARVQKGQLHEAIEDFEAATRLSPRFDQPQHNLGLVYQRLGRLDEAVAHYQAALAINDSYLDSHNNLGAIFYARRDYAGAKRHLKKVVEQDPSFALAWVNLALVSSETGNDAEAIEFSQRALELDPAQLNCRRILARALIHQRRFEEAIGQLQTLLVATPRDVDSQLLLQRLIAARRSSPSRGTNGSH